MGQLWGVGFGWFWVWGSEVFGVCLELRVSTLSQFLEKSSACEASRGPMFDLRCSGALVEARWRVGVPHGLSIYWYGMRARLYPGLHFDRLVPDASANFVEVTQKPKTPNPKP